MPVLTSIVISPPSAEIAEQSTQPFTAMGIYSDGSQADVTATAAWSSSATPVATVTAGSAMGVAGGTSTLTATVDGVSGTASLQVDVTVQASLAASPSSPPPIPRSLPSSPPNSEMVWLPTSGGSATFLVHAVNAGATGQVAVTMDTKSVPLPLTFTACVVGTNGACTAMPSASVSIPSSGATLLVTATSTSDFPPEAMHHRAWVHFSDGLGNEIATASVAVAALGATWHGHQDITTGGTYTGFWDNEDLAQVDAVHVLTTEPVVIENCYLRSKTHLVDAIDNAHVTIRDCNGYGLDPGVSGQTRGWFFFGADAYSVVIEHNYMDGVSSGLALYSHGSTSADDRITPDGPLYVRYNVARNLDGLASDGSGGRITSVNPNVNVNGFVSWHNFQSVAQGEIAWNEIIQEPYVSATSDMIDLWATNGTAATPILLHDNYIQGEYAPMPANGNGFNGTCAPNDPTCYGSYVAQAFTPDGSPQDTVTTATSFLKIYNNQVVNAWGGITALVGHDIEVYGNRVISTGQLSDGTWVSPGWAAGGFSSWDSYHQGSGVFFNNVFHDNVSAWIYEAVSSTDPSQYLSPPLREDFQWDVGNGATPGCSVAAQATCTNNTSLTGSITHATEANEWTSWQAKLAANSIVLGPRH